MTIGIVKEQQEGEKRVALTPNMVKRYQMDRMVIEKSDGFERRIFPEQQAAFAWLASLGFHTKHTNFSHQAGQAGQAKKAFARAGIVISNRLVAYADGDQPLMPPGPG